MVCISGGEDSEYPHSPGCRPYLSRVKRLRVLGSLVEISAESLNFRIERLTQPSHFQELSQLPLVEDRLDLGHERRDFRPELGVGFGGFEASSGTSRR